ncbi:MAG: hypothetical protein O2866_05540 [archaeon]|nr:hypothetical protein [archaeon]MDA0842460.1 hypothetical protein [archaeon]MDA1168329.1 hypothetical protein [archaeon]
MAPIWPFKKSKETIDRLPDEQPQKVVYSKGEDPFARNSNTGVDQQAYKDALALFGGGNTEVVASENQSDNYEGVVNTMEKPAEPEQVAPAEPESTSGAVSVPEPTPALTLATQPEAKYLHHTDGYHYKEKEGGGYESTPYVKNPDGSYKPYQ